MGACAIPKSQSLGEQYLCVVGVAYVPAEFVRGRSMPNMAYVYVHTHKHTHRHTSKAALVSGTSHVPVHVPLLTLIRNIRSQEKPVWPKPGLQQS